MVGKGDDAHHFPYVEVATARSSRPTKSLSTLARCRHNLGAVIALPRSGTPPKPPMLLLVSLPNDLFGYPTDDSCSNQHR
jgi:hypothetical protein